MSGLQGFGAFGIRFGSHLLSRKLGPQALPEVEVLGLRAEVFQLSLTSMMVTGVHLSTCRRYLLPVRQFRQLVVELQGGARAVFRAAEGSSWVVEKEEDQLRKQAQ